jgi:hypothetical protein
MLKTMPLAKFLHIEVGRQANVSILRHGRHIRAWEGPMSQHLERFSDGRDTQ